MFLAGPKIIKRRMDEFTLSKYMWMQLNHCRVLQGRVLHIAPLTRTQRLYGGSKDSRRLLPRFKLFGDVIIFGKK